MTTHEIAIEAVNHHIAMQVPEELEGLLDILQAKEVTGDSVKTVVEIGSFRGGMLWAYRQLLPEAKIISIDLGTIDPDLFQLQNIIDNQQLNVTLLKLDSQAASTLNKLKEELNNTPIDFLMIDAWHDYDHPKNEFRMYSPLVRKGGIVAFHDIKPHSEHGIYKYYEDEIRPNFTTHDILGPLHWGGIGVVYL